MKSEVFKYLFALLLPSVLISFAANSIILSLLTVLALVQLKTNYSKDFIKKYLWFSTFTLSILLAFTLDMINHQDVHLSFLTKRLSFVLLPFIVYYSSKQHQALALKVLVYFLSLMSTVLLIVGIIRSWLNKGIVSYGNWNSETTEAFYSENMIINWGELSYKRIFLFLDMHPTYYAFYSLIVMLIILFTPLIKIKVRYRNGLILLHALMIILISSKAGIISLILVAVFEFFRVWNSKKILLGLGIISVIIFSTLSIPSTQIRIKSAYDTFIHNDGVTSDSNLAGRINLWNSIHSFSPRELIIGSGTQTSRARVKSITGQDKNMHNQFLQALVSSGITGLILLLIFLFRPSFIYKNIFIYSFISLVVFNLFMENMLDRIWGIMIICFFYCLIIFGDPSLFKKDQKTIK